MEGERETEREREKFVEIAPVTYLAQSDTAITVKVKLVS